MSGSQKDAGPRAMSAFVTDVRDYFQGELAMRAGDIIVPRFVAKLFALGFAEAGYRIEAFEETEALAARLLAEIEICRATIRRLEQAQVVAAAAAVITPVATLPAGADIIDFAEIFQREQTVRGRPSEGGAA